MGAARLAAAPSRAPESLEKSVDHLLEECRMVLPGVQALFGFQLIAVFNQPFFAVLSPGERELHLVALVLVSLSVALVMAPAAYHRQAEPQRVSSRFLAYAGRMLMLAMVTLMIAVPLDVYLIARVILDAAAPAAVLALAVFGAFGVVWFVIPWRARGSRAAGARGSEHG
jgi:hypothetical protein